MAKQYTANSLTAVRLTIDIPASDKTSDGIEDSVEYYAGALRASAAAGSAAMQVRVNLPRQLLGNSKATPWTIKDIYQKVQSAPLNTIFADALKQLYVDGINEDIST